MADDQARNASEDAAEEPTTPRRRAPRRATSAATAPEHAATFSAAPEHPVRAPEQQIDVLAAFGMGEPTTARRTSSQQAGSQQDAAAEPAAAAPKARATRSRKKSEQPAAEQAADDSAGTADETDTASTASKSTAAKSTASKATAAKSATKSTAAKSTASKSKQSRAKAAEVASGADAGDEVEVEPVAEPRLPATALLFQPPAKAPRRRRAATSAPASGAAPEQDAAASDQAADAPDTTASAASAPAKRASGTKTGPDARGKATSTRGRKASAEAAEAADVTESAAADTAANTAADTANQAETEAGGTTKAATRRRAGRSAATAPAVDLDSIVLPERPTQPVDEQDESAAPAGTGRARRSRRATARAGAPAPLAAGSAPTEVSDAVAPSQPEAATDEAEAEQASEQAPQRSSRSRRGRGRQAAAEAPAEENLEAEEESEEEDAAETAAETDAEPSESDENEVTDEDGSPEEPATGSSEGSRRRRRRGGRGRRRSSESTDNGGEGEPSDAAAEDSEDEGESESEESSTGQEGTGSSSRRRRRRRGRSGSSEDGAARGESGARAARDEVTALKGSTRLEAKRLRRREGRDAGRRRQIITEAEFLARRESVERTMVVRERAGMTQIAVLEDDVLVEHYVARAQQTSMVGNVYLGRVQNVLPSMEAAFVDLGRGRNAVLYAGEVNWEASGLEGQPRRIEQALKSGDQILVQVTKDPIGHKGARLTAQITLAGRYLVLVPSGAMTGISRKLPDTERARLKKLLKEIVPDGQGVIVRTAAEGASEEELRRDVERLMAEWSEISSRTTGRKTTAPALLKGEPELALRVVRDVFNEDFSSLTVAGAGAWETISEYIGSVAPDLAERLHHWTSTQDVFASKRIDEQLAKGMDRKVWLPSGGSLVIDRTEAMTVVDVNTGKFTGSGGTLEETVTRNNLEAAEEIVRQLRLRDIGGIIVVDFIDMVLESNRDLVLRRLIECLGRDRTRHQVAEVTSLGLVQMTRKRVGQGLVEAFSTTCEACHGRGFIVSTQPHEHVAEPEPQEEESQRTGRRRGGRGSRSGSTGTATSGTPAPSAPVDPIAREAVKATLAQIAAAAQHAHESAEEAAGADAETELADQETELADQETDEVVDEVIAAVVADALEQEAEAEAEAEVEAEAEAESAEPGAERESVAAEAVIDAVVAEAEVAAVAADADAEPVEPSDEDATD